MSKTSLSKAGSLSGASSLSEAGTLSEADRCWASLRWALTTAELAMQCALVLAPYAAWQIAGYRRFCTTPKVAPGIHSPGAPPGISADGAPARIAAGGDPAGIASDLPSLPDWCVASWAPDLYRLVQATHWDVGPFRCWRLKQLPNFVLAAPALFICAAAVSASVAQLRRRIRTCLPPLRYSGDGRPLSEQVRPRRPGVSEGNRSGGGGYRIRRVKDALTPPAASPLLAYLLHCGPGAAAPPRPGALCARADIFIAHWALLSTFCLVCAHVQVTTRLVCAACPPFYWYLARLTAARQGEGGAAGADSHDARDPSGGAMRGGGARLHSPPGARLLKARRMLWCYFGLYAVGGTALHANFFPWT
jgi:phosphatidylinositol glycan class V